MKIVKCVLAILLATLMITGLAAIPAGAAEALGLPVPGSYFYEGFNFINLQECNENRTVVSIMNDIIDMSNRDILEGWPKIVHYDGSTFYYDDIDLTQNIELWVEECVTGTVVGQLQRIGLTNTFEALPGPLKDLIDCGYGCFLLTSTSVKGVTLTQKSTGIVIDGENHPYYSVNPNATTVDPNSVAYSGAGGCYISETLVWNDAYMIERIHWPEIRYAGIVEWWYDELLNDWAPDPYVENIDLTQPVELYLKDGLTGAFTGPLQQIETTSGYGDFIIYCDQWTSDHLSHLYLSCTTDTGVKIEKAALGCGFSRSTTNSDLLGPEAGIYIEAPVGLLQPGTTMHAAELPISGYQVRNGIPVQVWDITLDPEPEYPLNPKVTVYLPIPNDQVNNRNNLTVHYCPLGGSSVPMADVKPVQLEDGKWYMMFQTDHFSVYAIVATATTNTTIGGGSAAATTSADMDDSSIGTPQKWWQTLPSFVQLLLKIFLFGFIWMK